MQPRIQRCPAIPCLLNCVPHVISVRPTLTPVCQLRWRACSNTCADCSACRHHPSANKEQCCSPILCRTACLVVSTNAESQSRYARQAHRLKCSSPARRPRASGSSRSSCCLGRSPPARSCCRPHPRCPPRSTHQRSAQAQQWGCMLRLPGQVDLVAQWIGATRCLQLHF